MGINRATPDTPDTPDTPLARIKARFAKRTQTLGLAVDAAKAPPPALHTPLSPAPSPSPPLPEPTVPQGKLAADETGKISAANANDADEWPPPLIFPEDFAAEHRFERALFHQRIRLCSDRDVANILRQLVSEPMPESESAWFVMGRRWRDVEHDLRQQGRLPEVSPAAIAMQAA